MAIDYDPKDAQTMYLADIESFQGAKSFPVYSNCTLVANKQNMSKRKTYYTRPQSDISQPDRLTDVGNFLLGFEGTTATTPGRLYVEYEIRFMTPQTSTAATSVQNLSMLAAPAYNISPQQVEDGNFAASVGSMLTSYDGDPDPITYLKGTAIDAVRSVASNYTGSIPETILNFTKPGRYRIEGCVPYEFSNPATGTMPTQQIADIQELPDRKSVV